MMTNEQAMEILVEYYSLQKDNITYSDVFKILYGRSLREHLLAEEADRKPS